MSNSDVFKVHVIREKKIEEAEGEEDPSGPPNAVR